MLELLLVVSLLVLHLLGLACLGLAQMSHETLTTRIFRS